MDADQLVPPDPQKGYTLDLIFTSLPCSIQEDMHEAIQPTDDHHVPSWLSVHSPVQEVIAQPNREFFNLKNYDFAEIYDVIANTDWNSVLGSEDVNTCAYGFHAIINEILRSHVPLSSFSPSRYSPWFTAEL